MTEADAHRFIIKTAMDRCVKKRAVRRRSSGITRSMRNMKNEEKVLIVDFGGQYKELIARRVRECGVLLADRAAHESAQEIADMKHHRAHLHRRAAERLRPGTRRAATRRSSPSACRCSAICYGMQLMCHMLGGEVSPCERSEYGAVKARLGDCGLFDGCDGESAVLMSHTDRVTRAPEGFDRHRLHGALPRGRHAGRRARALRRAVPPGDRAHTSWGGRSSGTSSTASATRRAVTTWRAI